MIPLLNCLTRTPTSFRDSAATLLIEFQSWTRVSEWAEASPTRTGSRRDLWLWPSLTSPIISNRLTSNNTQSAATLQHHRRPQREKKRKHTVFFPLCHGLIPDSELLHREMKFFTTLVASQQTAIGPAARLTVFSQCGSLQAARCCDESPHFTSPTDCSAPKTLNFNSPSWVTLTELYAVQRTWHVETFLGDSSRGRTFCPVDSEEQRKTAKMIIIYNKWYYQTISCVIIRLWDSFCPMLIF